MYVSFSSGIGKATFFKNVFVKLMIVWLTIENTSERGFLAFIRLVCCAYLKSIEIHSKVPPLNQSFTGIVSRSSTVNGLSTSDKKIGIEICLRIPSVGALKYHRLKEKLLGGARGHTTTGPDAPGTTSR